MDEKLFNFVPVVTSLWSDFSDNNPKELLFRSVWSNLCILKRIGRCFQAVIMFWMNYMRQPTSVLQMFTACDQNLR